MGIFQRRFRRDVASGEKLNLTMPTTETGSPMVSPSSLQPFTSPPLEDAPIWNILPSYQLYESTFAKVMDPMIEEFNEEPPLYQDSPTHSSSSEAENDYFGRQPGPEASFHTPEPRWENSILANVHRMKYVDEFNKLVADKLIVETVLTKNVGLKGRTPEIYNSSGMEFSQGDSIHGYVVVLNTCDYPLDFDMFSVVFEGRISVNGNDAGSGTKPLLFYKFLNMFDYNASWTPACFEESSTTNLGPIDPVDGTTLQFPFQRQLEPGVAYKKFFNFTIPTKLLDCACETHEIPQHCVLFPSIGLDKNIFLSRLRKLREVPVKTGRTAFPCTPNKTTHSITSNSVSNKRNAPNITTRDYGFSDTSISYSVETKVIGKRSVYDKSAESKNEEFIIIKEASVPIRIVPRGLNTKSVDDDGYLAEKHFDAFHKSVKKCIEIGRALQDGKDTTKVSRKLSISKQTYDANSPNIRNSANDSIYKIHFPYKRKLLTQPARVVGSIIAFVPKKEHIVRYETPYIFTPSADFDTEKLAKLKARIDLEYVSTENDNKATRPPEIRGVAAKIMICTVRSKKYPIPIEISQEMKFRNIPGKNDSVENYVVAPFKTYLEEMSKFIGAYGTHQLGISKQLLVDVKSLANLESKTTSLKVDNITVHTKGGLGQWKESTNNNKAEKSIQIDVDIQSLFIKDSKRTIDDTLNGALALVPSFQSCIMCRYYYLLVEIKLGNGDIMPVKIPFRVSK